MKLLITGANGFIARNLRWHLKEAGGHDVVTFTRETNPELLPALLDGVQAIVHLAGINRPPTPDEFQSGNADLTAALCNALRRTGQSPAVIFASSVQAAFDNPYGRSKATAEAHLERYGHDTGAVVVIYRLPNVFGKWSRPNYNSAIATFCHNTARGLPIEVHKADAPLTLVYVDDVCQEFLTTLREIDAGGRPTGRSVSPAWTTTVGEAAQCILSFRQSRQTLLTNRVGEGLLRALYATYVSFLPADAFSYKVPEHADARGVFVEMLKTPDTGQFSYFTARPGITRGGHYHHSKTEKFLVIRGNARFRFRHIESGERHELFTNGENAEIVETAPGWTHDITNVGTDDMIVMLWANEIFDRQRPDTVASEV